jgi:hypothetical protein
MAAKKALKLPGVLITLGRAVEVKGRAVHYTWPAKDKVMLCAATNGKTLYCVSAKNKTKKNFATLYDARIDQIERGCDLYELWSDFEARSGSVVKPPRGFLFNVDRCESIIYASDKWTGRTQKYIHEFDDPPIVWVNNKTRPTVLVLSGGNIKTTKEGITG